MLCFFCWPPSFGRLRVFGVSIVLLVHLVRPVRLVLSHCTRGSFRGVHVPVPRPGDLLENYRTGTAVPAIGPCQEHSQRGNLTQAESGNSIQAGNGQVGEGQRKHASICAGQVVAGPVALKLATLPAAKRG